MRNSESPHLMGNSGGQGASWNHSRLAEIIPHLEAEIIPHLENVQTGAESSDLQLVLEV